MPQDAEIIIKARNLASATIDKVQRDFRDASKKIEGGFFEGLKNNPGLKNFKDVGELIKGGGILLGFREIGRAMNAIAERAQEWSKGMRDGTLSAREAGLEMAKSVPVIGEFVKAGQSIREFFTGEKEAIDFISQTAKNTDAITAYIAGQGAARSASRRQAEDAIRGYGNRTALANPFLTESERGITAENQAIFEESKRIADAAEAKYQQAKAEADRIIADIRTQLAAKPVILPDDPTVYQQLEQTKDANGYYTYKPVTRSFVANQGEVDRRNAERAALQGQLDEVQRQLEKSRQQFERDAQAQVDAAEAHHIDALLKAEQAGLDQLHNFYRDLYQKRIPDLAAAGAEMVVESFNGAAARAAHQSDVGSALNLATISRLLATGSGNGPAAGAARDQAEVLQIVETLKRERDQLQAIVSDPNASVEQRRRAGQLIDQLPQYGQSLYDAYQGTKPQLAYHSPYGLDSRTLSGASQVVAEQTATARASLKAQEDMSQMFRTLLASTERQGQTLADMARLLKDALGGLVIGITNGK